MKGERRGMKWREGKKKKLHRKRDGVASEPRHIPRSTFRHSYRCRRCVRRCWFEEIGVLSRHGEDEYLR